VVVEFQNCRFERLLSENARSPFRPKAELGRLTRPRVQKSRTPVSIAFPSRQKKHLFGRSFLARSFCVVSHSRHNLKETVMSLKLVPPISGPFTNLAAQLKRRRFALVNEIAQNGQSGPPKQHS